MEWLEMLEILERALEAAGNLPTVAERTRAIAAAYEAAAANLGNTTAKEVLRQISVNSATSGGRVGDLARLILRRVPEQAARAAITSGAGAGAGAGAGGRVLTFLGLSWGAWALLVGGGVLVIGGSYIYFRPDQPVQPGPAMTRPRPPTTDSATTKAPAPPPTTVDVSAGELRLVGSSSDPPTDQAYKPYWAIDKDAGTTRYEWPSQGVSADYSWKVPERIPPGGTAEFSIEGRATARKGNRLNATIGVSAVNLTVTPEPAIVNKTAEDGTPDGDALTVKVTDSSGASDATIKIYVGYTFRFDYVYRRAK